MSDIKKFTGFIAPDGTTHTTMQKATAYTLDLKIKLALEDFKLVTNATSAGVSEDDAGSAAIYPEDLPLFLFAHKADIMAAFKPEVTTRKKRVAKVPGAVKVAKVAKAAIAKAAAVVESPVMGAATHAGVLNLDE
jgi:hypothetical protein